MNTPEGSAAARRGGILELNAAILAAASVVGGKEREGPLGGYFDFVNPGDRFGQDTWESAESEMQRMALAGVLGKAHRSEQDVDLLLAGDLLNQCAGSAYGLLSYSIPYLGLYGACSTSAEGLLLAAALVSAGFAACAGVVTSSHNAAAERQFRTPLEYGGQRPQSGQWTVTGAGAFLVVPGCSGDTCPLYPVGTAPLSYIRAGMAGIVLDRGVTDANNMGAAMAPAAESTLCRFFEASGTFPGDYDLIVTGDLGKIGHAVVQRLFADDGVDLTGRYNDCGLMIYDLEAQDVHAGGSGCGCSASVLAGHLMRLLTGGKIRRLLFAATGALMSPTASMQGQSIPGICHAVAIETQVNA